MSADNLDSIFSPTREIKDDDHIWHVSQPGEDIQPEDSDDDIDEQKIMSPGAFAAIKAEALGLNQVKGKYRRPSLPPVAIPSLPVLQFQALPCTAVQANLSNTKLDLDPKLFMHAEVHVPELDDELGERPEDSPCRPSHEDMNKDISCVTVITTTSSEPIEARSNGAVPTSSVLRSRPNGKTKLGELRLSSSIRAFEVRKVTEARAPFAPAFAPAQSWCFEDIEGQ